MDTEISRYLVDADGNSFSSDTDLQSLSKNAKVKNTNSGVSYKKVQGTPGVLVFDKVPFKDNDTTYSAGTGLYLSGTQFNVRIPNVNDEYGNNDNYLMVLNTAQNKCVPVDININEIFEYVNQKIASSAPSYGSERIVYTADSNISSDQMVSGDKLYKKPGDGDSAPSARLSGTWKITSGLSYHHTYSWTETSSSGGSGQSSTTHSKEIYQCKAKQFLG